MKTYEDGLNEAWECTRKIACTPEKGGYTWSALEQIFNTRSLSNIINTYTASEAISKIKEYEEEQKKAAEIKIGDEVTDNDGWNGVVTCISPDGEYLVVTLQDGSALRWEKEHFKKTGRHFPEIAEVLKQMQEGNT